MRWIGCWLCLFFIVAACDGGPISDLPKGLDPGETPRNPGTADAGAAGPPGDFGDGDSDGVGGGGSDAEDLDAGMPGPVVPEGGSDAAPDGGDAEEGEPDGSAFAASIDASIEDAGVDARAIDATADAATGDGAVGE